MSKLDKTNKVEQAVDYNTFPNVAVGIVRVGPQLFNIVKIKYDVNQNMSSPPEVIQTVDHYDLASEAFKLFAAREIL